MDFEAMRVIWDSQNREPLYAINEAALHAIVRRRNRDFQRRAAWWQFREIVIGVIFGLVMLGLATLLGLGDSAWLARFPWIRVAVSRGDVVALIVAAGIWFYYGAFMFRARRRQLLREADFASSLQGDVERALDHANFQIRIARSIVWWGFVPAWIAMVLLMAVALHLKDVRAPGYIMLVSALAAVFILSVRWQYRAIRRQLEPRRQQVLALKAKIANPHASS
jgi:hypothetical protein